ncbi:energy transducer TonB [Sphingomonas sp. ZT3P38]|uniref:energy transducer TonB n=1 Tax=Parasphingomonas zepuensis TaxID=3096161 RepID=UPI002FC99B88
MDRTYLAVMAGALVWSLLGAATGHAQQPQSIIVVHSETDIGQALKEQRAEIAMCRRILRRHAALDRFLATHDLGATGMSRIAQRLWEGEGCRQDRSLAIRIMERVVGPEPLIAMPPDAVAQLAVYLRARGAVADAERSIELRRVLWLRGKSYSGLPPIAWSPGDLRAFVARQDVWTYLNRRDVRLGWSQDQLLFAALSDPESPRFDRERSAALAETDHASPERKFSAAQLLLPAAAGSDPAKRAEALLADAAQYNEAARVLFADLLRPRLSSGDRAIRNDAIAHLSAWSGQPTPAGIAARTALTPLFADDLSSPDDGVKTKAVVTLTDYVIRGTKEAELPLLRWTERALRGVDGPLKVVALRETQRLAAEEVPLGKQILSTEYRRHGGLARAGPLSREQGNLTSIFTDDSYPREAVRAGEEGVVEASAILSPEGSVMAVMITRSASPTLGKTVARLLSQRARGIRPVGFPGRYVQVQLPPIQFSLRQCQENLPQPPVVPGALLLQMKSCPTARPDFVLSN